jgi:histone acetyltransferase MYST1
VRRANTPPVTDPDTVPPVNVNKVIYGSFEIGAWYYSPYPFDFGSFIDRLYICDYCLRYMNKEIQLSNHKVCCEQTMGNHDTNST